MVFSSVPAYLDPSNWHPQHINHQIIGSSAANHLLPLPPASGSAAPPAPPLPQPHGVPGSGSIRPGSMSERARLANIPMPEAALKCPRCESTNTKFCYFNNYSLSQPRHFCKTCRRYWTRGGALRSVPVGGGCRRNKRTKSAASSKSSPASSDGNRQTGANSGSTSGTNNTVSNNYAGNNSSSLLNLTPPQFQPLRFMSPLGQLSDNFAGDLGLSNYAGGSIAAANDQMGFHGSSSFLGMEPWKLQQFPFLGGLDSPAASAAGVYQFHGGDLGFLGGGEVRPKISSSLLSQMASVKMEDSQNPNLRQLLGGMQGNGNDEQWNNIAATGAPNWTELSNFSSSSTSNPLQ